MTKLFGTGFALANEEFDPNASYRACLICGDVYQSALDRAKAPYRSFLSETQLQAAASTRREFWASEHARKKHTLKEHMMLQLSGLSMTPEAAHKLAAFGLIPISDMLVSEEIKIALLESDPEAEDVVQH